MSVSPTTGLSKLSLEGMAPTTRSQSQHALASAEAGMAVVGQNADIGSDRDSDNDSDSELDESDELDGHIIRSPFTNLLYDISRLPTIESTQGSGSSLPSAPRHVDPEQELDMQGSVRDHFRETLPYQMPDLTLYHCNLGQGEGKDFYAFELRENIPITIRIGSPTSEYSHPYCSCSQGKARKPCHHLLWLFDNIAKLTLYDHNNEDPLVVNEDMSVQRLGSLFERIADFRLDFLAGDLHCDVGDSSLYSEPNLIRVREAWEILSAFEDFDHDKLDISRQDPFQRLRDRKGQGEGKPTGSGDSKRDLWETMGRILVASNEVFSLFLNFLSPEDKVRNPYFKLEFRVNRILEELKSYSDSLSDEKIAAERRDRGSDLEVTCNVAWASKHILGAMSQLQGMLKSRGADLEHWEKASAAQALMRILGTIVFQYARDMYPARDPDDRNLYQRLIGNHDTGFVVDALALITDQNQYIDRLEEIKEEVKNLSVPLSYAEKLDNVIRLMRASARLGIPSWSARGASGRGGAGGRRGSGSSGGAGSKRPGSIQEHQAKRVR